MPQWATGNVMQGQSTALATVAGADGSQQQHIKSLGHLPLLMWHQCYKKGQLIKHNSH